ncbi:MAG: SUMF1/EgtB/PvdO family nonheme iron enzyme [Anaerolineae bacterium]|nr:SUMF1/EgtB/PvdO family nonheme iron enzyme [Anaerolineae bacterium]
MKRAHVVLLALIVLVSGCALGRDTEVVEVQLPTIEILSPASGARVVIGEELEIESRASDARGINRVELWIDGGIYRVDEARGQTAYRVIQRWRADALGEHEVKVQAVNVETRTSMPATIMVEVVERAESSPTPAQAPAPTDTALPVIAPTDTPAPTSTPRPTATATVGAATGTPTATLTLTPTVETTPSVAGMVLVPSGRFTMGSNEDHVQQAADWCGCSRANFEDELYMHEVQVSAFYIDVAPVTNRQYQAFVAATGYRTEAERKSEANTWRTVYTAGKDDHPVVWMSWNDAAAYCEWAGKRLPTEAEWEKAARGADARLWPWGNNWDNARLNMAEGGRKTTTPVGSFPTGASPYGAVDMAGNVWEWVADWYSYGYYQTEAGRSADPQGPPSGEDRVLRGGGYNNGVWDVRTANRHKGGASGYAPDHGFRCARSAQ